MYILETECAYPFGNKLKFLDLAQFKTTAYWEGCVCMCVTCYFIKGIFLIMFLTIETITSIIILEAYISC